jgi:hypothetical protein
MPLDAVMSAMISSISATTSCSFIGLDPWTAWLPRLPAILYPTSRSAFSPLFADSGPHRMRQGQPRGFAGEYHRRIHRCKKRPASRRDLGMTAQHMVRPAPHRKRGNGKR